MSGHSKWSSIKHKKAATDAKKGKAFTQVTKMITIAARQGGDPEMNFSLRLAIDKAKTVNMPKENIDRAIKKGTGELKGEALEEITYEGYGPEGVAFLAEVTTDNKNRTASLVRSTFTKSGGSLGATGSVAWMFDKKGQIIIGTKNKDIDETTLQVIDAGALDVEEVEGQLFVYTSPQDLMKVKTELDNLKIETEEYSLEYIANTQKKITEKDKLEKMMKLVDELEEIDEVVSVYTNVDIDSRE